MYVRTGQGVQCTIQWMGQTGQFRVARPKNAHKYARSEGGAATSVRRQKVAAQHTYINNLVLAI